MENLADIEATAWRLESEGAQFFLVSNAAMKPALEMKPFGMHLTWIDALESPTKSWSVLQFLKLYNLIDGLAFGERGLAMPHWVMVDLALLPSAIVIAAWPKERLLEEVQNGKYAPESIEALSEILDEAESLHYDGPVPVAAYCASPTIQPSRFVGWSLWSFVKGNGFATAVKGLAVDSYKARIMDGVTQYDNVSLRIHTKFGPLRLRSASLGIHTAANSFVYETDLVSDHHHGAEPSFWMDANDTERQQSMHKAIELRQADYYVIAPGLVYENNMPKVPILEVPVSNNWSE